MKLWLVGAMYNKHNQLKREVGIIFLFSKYLEQPEPLVCYQSKKLVMLLIGHHWKEFFFFFPEISCNIPCALQDQAVWIWGHSPSLPSTCFQYRFTLTHSSCGFNHSTASQKYIWSSMEQCPCKVTKVKQPITVLFSVVKVSFSCLACALLSVCLLYTVNKTIDQSLLLRQLCSLNLELYVEKSPAEQWKSVHTSTMPSRLAWGLFLVSTLFMSICGKDKINYPLCVFFAIYLPICM